MSYDTSLEDLKNLRITVGNAVNATATLASRQEDPIAYFAEHLHTVVGAVVEAQAFHLAQAGLGATHVPDPGNVVPFPQQSPVHHQQPPVHQPTHPPVPFPAAPHHTAPPQPAPIPGASNGADPAVEANWMAFFTAWNAGQVAPSFQGARDGQWFDNRVGKNNPKAPDFKVKGRDQGLPAVWLNDKKNPAWVATAVQQAGL